MRRKIKLAALLVLVAVLMTGCMDFSALQSSLEAEIDPNATPEPTTPPLTAPVFTDRDAVYAWYNEVNIGDTLEDLTARYGEPVVESDNYGETYIWTDEEGYGFAGVFFDDGRLRAKVVNYEDMRQFKELSGATSITNFATLNTDHDFTMACMALGGKPCEIAVFAQDESINPETQHLYAWLDQYGSSIQILFGDDEKIVQISYALVDEKTE